MKIIFLDIDGVLNCDGTSNPRKFPYVVDPILLHRFNHLLTRTAAQVVLSSSWRYDPAGLFSARFHGIPFIDVTPDLPHEPRRKEILAWLRERPIERFAVIDDQDDELDDLPLFQPYAGEGLTDEVANAVADYLTGKADRDMRRSGLARALQNVAAMARGHKG